MPTFFLIFSTLVPFPILLYFLLTFSPFPLSLISLPTLSSPFLPFYFICAHLFHLSYHPLGFFQFKLFAIFKEKRTKNKKFPLIVVRYWLYTVCAYPNPAVYTHSVRCREFPTMRFIHGIVDSPCSTELIECFDTRLMSMQISP